MAVHTYSPLSSPPGDTTYRLPSEPAENLTSLGRITSPFCGKKNNKIPKGLAFPKYSELQLFNSTKAYFIFSEAEMDKVFYIS